MNLAELLEGKFRGDIRFRGSAYVKAERVAVTRITAERVFAVVRDGVEFQTQLSREEDQLRMFCNCSADKDKEVRCKHLWATIIAIDEGGLLTASPRPGYIPPFAVESEPFSWDDDIDDFEMPGDVYLPIEHRKPGATGPRKVQPVLRSWETALKSLKTDLQSPDAVGNQDKASREREIFYEIDAKESRTAGMLVIQTSQRQRRANGQWGKLKALKLKPGKTEFLERDVDRRMLAYLSGGVPERGNWYAQQSEQQTSVYRYRVPYELCEMILPELSNTGRLRFLGTEESVESLEWDDGEPWELTVCVKHEVDEERWILVGSLTRGEESLPLDDTELLVPGGLVVTKTRVARLRDYDAFDWIKMLRRDDPVEVPDGEEHELVDQLFDMPTLPRMDLPEQLRLEEVEADPIPRLMVRSPKAARWHLERLNGEIMFEYLGADVRASSNQWAIVQRDQGRCIIRSRDQEEKYWGQLRDHGFRRLVDQRRGGHDVEIAAKDLGNAVRHLVELGWQVHADGKQVRQPGEMKFRVQSNIDWFELHAEIDFGGSHTSFPELLSALARGDTTIRLDDGSLGIVPEEWIKQFGLLAGLGDAQEDHMRFGANQVALLDALLATQSNVSFDDQFLEIRERFKNFSGVDGIEEREEFQGELRGYQREGLGWLSFLQEFRLGGCLADDMGLGKTVQVLAMLQHRVRDSKKKLPPSLVVVPKSLLFNWKLEAHRFTPELSVLEYTGLERANLRQTFGDKHLIFTTYGTLRRDVMLLKDLPFDYIVLDEAQTIKNSASQVAKACRLMSANFRIAMSGTPIENHLGDLWSIFEFLNPGMLGRSSLFKTYATDANDEASRKMLAQGLRPFILRRTKSEVAAELPEKYEQTILCDMGKEQRRRYDEMRMHYRDTLLGIVKDQGLAKSKMHVLEALLRLRQAACHPALLDKSTGEERSAKLDVLCSQLEELVSENHKALVFSQFTSMLAIVKRHLDKLGIRYEYLDGQTRDRQERVENFQNDEDIGVFLISLKAGGLGLNLTAADYVFLLDPWWNPAVEQQAIDRAHRVGQTRQVFAYRLICRDTVEEKIAELQKKKRSLAEAILEADSSTVLKDLSSEDLEMLLS
ncbi:MAG: SNF2-related protein [Planctomycetota bacterium]|nr:SNF2-related protein [Planctomycetota bacterium]